MGLVRKTQKQFFGARVDLPTFEEHGSQYIAVDTEEFFVYDDNGSAIELTGTGQSLTHRVICNQANHATTLGGVIDSTIEYFIDGVIDMGTTSITVPTTGMTLRGHSFDISGLTSTADNYTMFISESALIGSGNVLGQDYYIQVSGTSSKVYEIYDATGFNAFEFQRVNYIGCTSLGDIHNYRQGLESGTGRFGGSPSLTLHGTWVGGFRITTSITRSMSDTTTEPLFKAGTAFVMNSRFLTDMNVDLGTLQPLLDFAPSNFTNTDTLQLQGMLVTRDGVTDASDANITPNITEKDLASQWSGNLGLHNTFVGGMATLITEVVTPISATDTAYTLLGTQIPSGLQHFDSPVNGQLRLLGNIPVAYSVVFDFVVEGTSNATYELQLVKDSGGVETIVQSQKRVVNALQGGRDMAYFNGLFNLTLHTNDFIYWKIANKSGTGDATLELDSMWHIQTR